MVKSAEAQRTYRAKRMVSIQQPGDNGYGVSSTDGSMKKAIAYHGTSADFDQFDSNFAQGNHQYYGEGFYLASSPESAALYGNNVFEVEVTYSTDRRTSKKTGRQQDFNFNPSNGYWVIPHDKASNIKILSKKKVR